MKFIIKKDMKNLLPGFAMFVSAGIGMFAISLYAVLSGNGNFAVSAFTVFFYLELASIVYTAIKGANVFRKNLSDDVYIGKIKEGGIGRHRFLIYKLLQSMFMQAILVAEYALLIGTVLLIGEKKLNFGEEGSGILARIGSERGTSEGIITVVLVFLELLMISVAVTALAFLAFALCYKFFLKHKYAFPASLMTYFTMLWVVWKLFDLLVPKGGNMAKVGTALFAAVLAAGLSFIFVLVMGGNKNNEEII